MPPSIVLAAAVAFILFLFLRDFRGRSEASAALWIPLLWVLIISTKPISLWFGSSSADSNGYLEDKLIDKVIFIFLIVAGLIVINRRRVLWSDIFRNNKWLFAYFLYLGVSVLWSDESFVSFKRWIKDIGNIVMVLIVLSDENQDQAVSSFFARFAWVIVPLSVISIKYFPEFSRHYDSWTNQPVFVGLTTDKNTFGMTLFVCELSLIWLALPLLEKTDPGPNRKMRLFGNLILICMTAWLLKKAHSATAITCAVLGGGVLLAMR
ncbi:MAG TPA: hypothetical protein VK633_10100, partial [Verrucomicrobiae bacterium]|nr:hypothetical protein [Verrucomicrobiae bacterium]